MMLPTSRSSTRARALVNSGVVNAVSADTRKTIRIKVNRARVNKARVRVAVRATDVPVGAAAKAAPIVRTVDALSGDRAAVAAVLWVPWTTAIATRTARPHRETA